MRVGISNVAWQREEDEEIVALLPELGIEAIEVAPTRLWDEPFAAPLAEYRARAGLPIVSLQSLLFGHPELQVFGDGNRRTLEHLQGMCDVAAELGAQVLVLGSPGNRRRNGRPVEDAIGLFRELGAYADERALCVCIEALPDADFVQTVAEAVELAEAVDSPGFGVHLDSAVLHATGEAVESPPRHFHATEIGFGVLGTGGVDHARYARQLREVGYQGVVSIEMFAEPGSNRDRVLASVEQARRLYG